MRRTACCIVLALSVIHVVMAPFPADAGDRERPHTDTLGDPLPDGALARFGTTRFRTPPEPYGVILSPDGKLLAVPYWSGGPFLDAVTGKAVRRRGDQPPSPLYYSSNSQFSSDGARMAVVHRRTAEIYDVVKGKVVRTFDVGRDVTATTMSFSGNGKLLAIGVGDGSRPRSVTLWDVDAGKQVQAVKAPRMLPGVTLSLDGKVLATWGWGGLESKGPAVIELWEAASGKRLRTIELQARAAHAVTFSPDCKQLLAVDDQGVARLWELPTGKQLHRFSIREQWGEPAFSPNGAQIVAGTQTGRLEIWDSATGKQIGQYKGPGQTLMSTAFRRDGTLVAAGLTHQAIHVWEVASGHELSPPGGQQAAVRSLAFSRDGKTLWSAGSDGAIAWEVATGKGLRRIEAPQQDRRSPHLPPIPWVSPDARFVSWNMDRGRLEVMPTAPGGARTQFEDIFPRDRLRIVFAAERSWAVVLVDVLSKRGWAPEARYLDLAKGKVLQSFPVGSGGEPFAVAVSADGELLALPDPNDTARSHEVGIWRRITGKQHRALRVDTMVTAMAFSSDGSILATAEAGGTIRLWSMDDGAEIGHWRGPEFCDVLTVSPDGRTLASISWDDEHKVANVVVWEVASGTMRLQQEVPSHLRAQAFSTDGRSLATGGDDTTILLWDLTGRTQYASSSRDKPTAQQPTEWWSTLGNPEAATAHGVMGQLIAHPDEAVALLRRELKGEGRKSLTDKEVARLIAELDDDSYRVREVATAALEAAGQQVRTALRSALRARPTPEARRRLHELLAALPDPTEAQALERRRTLRALEVLEWLGTPPACRLLEELAAGPSDALLTTECKAALRRLR
jgi:WD40 repeat protein